MADIINILLTLRSQIKIYHWQTGSFARHKTTDDLVSSLDEKIDKFVEVHMGRYGVPHFSKSAGKITVHDSTDKNAANLLHAGVKFLEEDLPKFLKKSDTDLLNIRDDILADLNQAIFLFRLR
jgi:DNA-directed RNA polymerase subunit L